MTGHMLPGESTSAALRRVTGELATARTELEQRGRAITEADATLTRVRRELDNARRVAADQLRLRRAAEEQNEELCDLLREARTDADVARDELATEVRSHRNVQLRAMRAETELSSAREELDRLRAAQHWIVARDGGRWCERCEGEVTRGQAYEMEPGTGGLVVHIHCPDPIDEEKSMTGPEHYQEAERLLRPRTVQSIPSGRESQAPPTTDMILQAQVHATLALAAATALAAFDGSGMHVDDFRAWDRTCGVNPGPADV